MVEEFKDKPEGYQTGAKVTYKGYIFEAAFWTRLPPGEGDADHNGWRLYDEQSSGGTGGSCVVIGYLPAWKKEAIQQIHTYKRATHLIVCFLTLTDSGEFTKESLNQLTPILTPVVDTCRASHTKCMVAIGGAENHGFKNCMTSIGNNRSSSVLASLASRINDFVNHYGLDGIDLDLECWWPEDGSTTTDEGGRKSDSPHLAGQGLTLLAESLRRLFGDKKVISAAVPATSWYGNNFDGEQLVKYINWFGIMSYDLSGSWNASPVGPHSILKRIDRKEMSKFKEEQQAEWDSEKFPIQSVQESVWYWTNPFSMDWLGPGQKIPRNKIVIGVPMYGYDFAHDKGAGKTGYATLTYNEIASKFPNELAGQLGSDDPNIKVKGSAARPYFVKKAGNYQYEHNIYFDTPHTAKQKMDYARAIGAQGVMVWETTNDVPDDSRSIMHALYANSGNAPKGDFKVPDSLASAGAINDAFAKHLGAVAKLRRYFSDADIISMLADLKKASAGLTQLKTFDFNSWLWTDIDTILEVDQTSQKINAMCEAMDKAQIGTGAVGAAGGILTLAGFILSFFTGGLSLGLSVAGMSLSIPAGISGFAAGLIGIGLQTAVLEKLSDQCKKQANATKPLVNMLKDISQSINNVENKIKIAVTAADRKDDMKDLGPDFMSIFDMIDLSKDLVPNVKLLYYFYNMNKLGTSFILDGTELWKTSDLLAKTAREVAASLPLPEKWLDTLGDLVKVSVEEGSTAASLFAGVLAVVDIGLGLWDIDKGVKKLKEGSEKAKELQKNAHEFFNEHVTLEEMYKTLIPLA